MNRISDHLSRPLLSALTSGAEADAAALLARSGFRHPEQIVRPLRDLTGGMKPRARSGFLRALLAALPASPDPDQALVALHRFAEARFGAGNLEKIATLPAPALGLLLRVFGASAFLAGLLAVHPDWLDWMAADSEFGLPRTLRAFSAQLAEAVRGVEGAEPRRLAALRAFRRELLRLSVRRLMNLSEEMEMARELSDLAQATLAHSLDEVTPPLVARFGRPTEEMAEDSLAPQRHAAFAVIGMGKLGGRELNFSSDIDLIFIYSDEGETSGAPDGSGRITNHAFFTRLAEALIDWIMSPSDEGYFYRVDTRLRPDGETGPLARSLGSCEIYYTTQARLWERLALLKARTVAGDARLGHLFESMIRPLVFDPLHSHELILQIADLKQRIDAEIRRKAGADRELKRGAGGIREIEFLVQTLQMLHGAANNRLWTAETLDAIRQLAQAAILPGDQARRMSEDYVWLRTVEHRLQMAHLRQTHTLPEEPEALDAVALAAGLENAECGMRNAESGIQNTESRIQNEKPETGDRPGERLMARWAEISARVHHDFREFFERSERAAERAEAELTGGAGPARDDDPAAEAAELILSSQPEGAILAQLAPWGIASGGALKVLRRLGGMGRTMYLTTEGRLAWKQLLPVILRLLAANPQPEKALAGLESFLYASGAIAGYYTTFLRNRTAFELLLLAFGSGATLAQTLIAHPEFLDIIADPVTMSTASGEGRRDAMRRMLFQWAGAGTVPSAARGLSPSPHDDLARFCRALARLKRLEFLLAGLGELAGLLDYPASCDRMNAMAMLVLEQALTRAARELGMGAPPAGFAVLAMGKLGTGELNYYSDLDLIFAWDEDDFTPARLAPAEDAAALGNRIIEILTHPTPEGAPFNVDTRLRPEGQNAPLAPPLARYVEYYASGRAQTWELQSAMKLRPVAGDLELGRRLARAVGAVIAGKVRGLDLGAEIRAMRRRMEAAVKPSRWVHCDFKTGPGGSVDLEFTAQYLQLRHLAADPELMGLGPAEVFARLAGDGFLDKATARQLAADTIWLRRLERRARLLFESDKSQLPAGGEKLAALERACEGLVREQGERTLIEATDKVLRRNRRHFEEIVR